MTLPAAAAERRLHAYAANQLHAAAAVDQRDRQTDGRTDGRTDTRPLHRPCSACYVGSVSQQIVSQLLRCGLIMTEIVA